MRLSETDNIKTDIEKRKFVNYIEIHDRDYIRNNVITDRIGNELDSRSFNVTLYNFRDEVNTCITCKIFYYLIKTCISQELKRFFKKYNKFRNSKFTETDMLNSPSAYYYKKMGVYMPKKHDEDDFFVLRNKVYQELKNYVQYHPLFLQVVGNIDNYDVYDFDYFTELI